VKEWSTTEGLSGAAMLRSGLSSVGPPPVTSSSQLSRNRRTAESPPYSRLSDPDGNGVELYCDRPRSDWFDADGRPILKAERFDYRELL
jgi:hypothetical protein